MVCFGVLFHVCSRVVHITAFEPNQSMSHVFLSPVKFAGGGNWHRGPLMTGSPSLLSPSSSMDQPMEVSAVEQMDTSGSGFTEASAPLPIRHPSGISIGPYKKQAYPMNSKRPEHLRMNLWRSARLRTPALFECPFLFLLSFQRDL